MLQKRRSKLQHLNVPFRVRPVSIGKRSVVQDDGIATLHQRRRKEMAFPRHCNLSQKHKLSFAGNHLPKCIAASSRTQRVSCVPQADSLAIELFSRPRHAPAAPLPVTIESRILSPYLQCRSRTRILIVFDVRIARLHGLRKAVRIEVSN